MKLKIKEGKSVRAARDLTPAQQTAVRSIHTRLDLAEGLVKEAKAAFTKWQQGPKFDPQKDNLQAAWKQLYQLARAGMSLMDQL